MSNDSRSNSGSSAKGLKSRLQNTSLQMDLSGLKQKASGLGKKLQEKMAQKNVSGSHAGSARQLKDNGYDSVNLADVGEIFILKTQNKIDFDDLGSCQRTSAQTSLDFGLGSEPSSYTAKVVTGRSDADDSVPENNGRVEFSVSIDALKDHAIPCNDIGKADLEGISDNTSTAPIMDIDDPSSRAPASMETDEYDIEESSSTFNVSIDRTTESEGVDEGDMLAGDYVSDSDEESCDSDDESVDEGDGDIYQDIDEFYSDYGVGDSAESDSIVTACPDEMKRTEIPMEVVSAAGAEPSEEPSEIDEIEILSKTEIPMEVVSAAGAEPSKEPSEIEISSKTEIPMEVVASTDTEPVAGSVAEPVEKLRLGPATPVVRSSLRTMSVNEIEGVKGLAVEGEVSQSADSISTGMTVKESLQVAETSAGAVQNPGYMNLTVDGEGVRTLSDPKRRRPESRRARTMRFNNGVLQNTEPQEELQGPLD